MNNTNKFLLLVSILLGIIAGCVPVGSNPQDLYASSANAAATQSAISAAFAATNAVATEAAQRVTLSAAETKGAAEIEITLIALEIQATRSAHELSATTTANSMAILITNQEMTQTARLTETAVPLTATAMAIIVAEEMRDEDRRQRQYEWEQYIIPIRTLAPTLLLLLAVILLLVGLTVAFRYIIPTFSARMGTFSRGEKRAPWFFIRHGGKILLLDSDRSFGPVLQIGPGGIVSTTALAPSLELQNQLNQMRAMVDVADGLQVHDPIPTLDAARRSVGVLPDITVPAGPYLPERADWQILKNSQIPDLLLGLGEGGNPIAPSIDAYSHRLYGGMTSAGKSRLGIRPTIAQALTHKWQVISFGDLPPVDFGVFEGHANWYSITLEDPATILNYLAAIHTEIRQRWNDLYLAGISTWGRMANAAPRIMVVIDEFASMAEALNSSDRLNYHNSVTHISRVARKAGIHLILGAQNPTADSVRPSTRRNMLTIAFRVADQRASLAMIGTSGAEKLSQGQFLALQDAQLIKGVAFAPSDQDIVDYLQAYPVPQLPAPDWFIDPPELANDQPVVQNQLDTKRAAILQMIEDGDSISNIETKIFGYHGGYGYRLITRLMTEYETTTTTPT